MRIALAMSGAIALVLYESGVAQEVHSFLNRKGAYARALDKAKLKPVVDILTGASAGGINSVLLGHCFVTGSEFSEFGDIWIQQAGVDKLRYPEDAQDVRSVLDVDLLKKSINEIFERNLKIYSKVGGECSPDEEIKVRICRTDLRGFCVSTVDAAGHRIDVQSRSDVVVFDHGAFEDKDTSDILLAAVATSAFPIAFPAVYDPRIGRWYVDGGLWDNQPIDLAVEAIRDKAAFVRTHRCVLFIDPDPSVMAEEDNASLDLSVRKQLLRERAAAELAKEPSVLETATFIPGLGVKGNVLPALESVLDYNRRIELYRQAISLPFFLSHLKEIADDVACPRTGPDAFLCLSLLDQARIHAVVFDSDPKLIQSWAHIRENIDGAAGNVPQGQSGALQQLVDICTDLLSEIEEIDIVRRSLRRTLTAVNDDLRVSAAPQEHYEKKKRIYLAIADANAILDVSLDEANDLVGTSLAFREHRREQVSRFWAASIHALDLLTKEMNKPVDERDVFGTIAKTKSIWRETLPQPGTPAKVDFDLHKKSLKDLESWLKEDPADPKTKVRVVDITPEDKIRYVLASFADLDGKTPVDLVRISPNDTNNLHLIGSPAGKPGQTPAGRKLAGEELGHLSGFLEERWRRNDYIWGRLDSAEILLKALFNTAKKEARALDMQASEFDAAEYEACLREVQAAILSEESDRYLRHSGSPIEGTGVPTGDVRDEGIVKANNKLIGFGGEGLADEAEPQQKDNLNYVVLTLLKIMRGKSAYHQGIIKRFGSSIMDHVAIDIADRFLERFRKKC